MPSVRDNTKFKCNACGAIEDFEGGTWKPCMTCGAFSWDQIMVTKVCDFCATTQNVRWEFPCEDFMLPVAPGLPDQGFRGAWSACDDCKGLIEEADIDGLLARAVLMDPDKDNPIARTTVLNAHTAFFTHRTGPPVLFREEDD